MRQPIQLAQRQPERASREECPDTKRPDALELPAVEAFGPTNCTSDLELGTIKWTR